MEDISGGCSRARPHAQTHQSDFSSEGLETWWRNLDESITEDDANLPAFRAAISSPEIPCPDVAPSKNSRWSHLPWLIVLSGPSVPSGSGSRQCTRTSPQLSARRLFNAGPTTEGWQLSAHPAPWPAPALPPMCMAHPALQAPPEQVTPLEEGPILGASRGQVLAEGGRFPLSVRMLSLCFAPGEMQARSQHWQMLPL